MSDAPLPPPPPPPPPPSPPRPQWDAPQRDPGAAVKGPAIALIVYNGLVVLMGLVNAVAIGFAREMMSQMAKQDPQFQQVADLYHRPWFVVLAVIGALVAAVALVGSIFMLQRKSYAFALAATVLTLINFAAGCCCCPFGVGLGIWALVVLMRDEVRQSFNPQ